MCIENGIDEEPDWPELILGEPNVSEGMDVIAHGIQFAQTGYARSMS